MQYSIPAILRVGLQIRYHDSFIIGFRVGHRVGPYRYFCLRSVVTQLFSVAQVSVVFNVERKCMNTDYLLISIGLGLITSVPLRFASNPVGHAQ